MPVTAEELRKLAEEKQKKKVVTADDLRKLAEEKKKQVAETSFTTPVQQPQPPISYEPPQAPNLFEQARHYYNILPAGIKTGIKFASLSTGTPIINDKQVDLMLNVAGRTFDLMGRPFYAQHSVTDLEEKWLKYELSGGKKGEKPPDDLMGRFAAKGQAFYKGLSGKEKATWTTKFDRWVEEWVPDANSLVGQLPLFYSITAPPITLGSLKPVTKFVATAAGESLDPRWILMGYATESVLGAAKKLFLPTKKKHGINLLAPAFRGTGSKATTTDLVVDDVLTRMSEGVFPDLAKKSGIKLKLAGREIGAIDPSVFSQYIDEMSGMFNQRALSKLTPYLDDYARISKKPITVVTIDGNGMGILNEGIGRTKTDEILKSYFRFIDSQTKATGSKILWFRPYEGGDEMVGISITSVKDVQKTLNQINNSMQKTVFRVPSTGQPAPQPLSFGGNIMSMKPRRGAIEKLIQFTDNNLEEFKLGIESGGYSPELKKVVFIGRKFKVGGKNVEFVLPSKIAPNSGYGLRGRIYTHATETLGLSGDDLIKFNSQWDKQINEIINRGGILDDIVDDIARLANEAGYKTKVKPMLKAEPVIKPEPTPPVPPSAKPGVVPPKVEPPTEMYGGIPIWKEIKRIDEWIWKQEQRFGKWFVKKLKPITKDIVRVSDDLREVGVPEVLEVDKPYWAKVKSIFGQQSEQKKVIEMINRAKSEIYKEQRAFVEENPVIKELYKLTPEERHGIFAIGEGRAMPTKLFGTRAQNVLRGLQELGDTRARELLSTAKELGLNITDDILNARKMQPLMKLTGQSIDELVAQGFDPDKFIYFRHYNPKYFKNWTGKFLKFPIRKWKPGFLKKSKGLWTYLDDSMTDPAITVPVQNAEFVEFRVRWKLLNDIKETLGKPLPKSGELLPGYVKFEPAGKFKFYPLETATGGKAVGVTQRGVEAFQIPSAVKTELDSFLGRAGALEKILNLTYDKATNVWRASVLALSPRWVVYNTLGNTTLNALGDVSPKSYVHTVKMFYDAGKIAKKEGVSFRGALARMGVPDEVATGLYESEVGAALRNVGIGRYGAKTTIKNIAEFAGWLPSKTYKINSRIESFYRVAHYLDKITKGYSKEKAISSVNEFLFDYGALSWSERSIIRRVIPFYSWTKNISRLAITYPLKHPVRTAAMATLAKIGTDYLRDNFGVVIDWSRNEVKIPSGDGKTYYVIRARGANPFADVVSPFDLFGDNGLTELLSKVNPLIKVPIERATRTQIMPWGAKSFTAPVYKKDEYGREIRPLPSLGRHIATQFPQFQLYEQITKPYATYTATGEAIIGKGGKTYPRNTVLDILRFIGANLTTEDIFEVQKRKLLKEYNDKQYETEQEKYKLRKEIVLDISGQSGGVEQSQPLKPVTADELRKKAELEIRR